MADGLLFSIGPGAGFNGCLQEPWIAFRACCAASLRFFFFAETQMNMIAAAPSSIIPPSAEIGRLTQGDCAAIIFCASSFVSGCTE
jgi:hypothetical protein